MKICFTGSGTCKSRKFCAWHICTSAQVNAFRRRLLFNYQIYTMPLHQQLSVAEGSEHNFYSTNSLNTSRNKYILLYVYISKLVCTGATVSMRWFKCIGIIYFIACNKSKLIVRLAMRRQTPPPLQPATTAHSILYTSLPLFRGNASTLYAIRVTKRICANNCMSISFITLCCGSRLFVLLCFPRKAFINSMASLLTIVQSVKEIQ